jgi:hypothetical protein
MQTQVSTGQLSEEQYKERLKLYILKEKLTAKMFKDQGNIPLAKDAMLHAKVMSDELQQMEAQE